MIDTKLKGKTALVTGANNPHGIGAATAAALCAQGARVFISYLRIPPEEFGFSEAKAARATDPGLGFYFAMLSRSADEVMRAIRDQGGQVEAWEVDLAKPSAAPKLFDKVEEAFGPVDILINNAAYDRWPETIFSTDAETIDSHFAVNTRAVVLMVAEYVRRFKRRDASWGRIVNLSTDAAQCFTGSISYGASKAATEAFTRSIAVEVGPLGITVNALAPGPVQTGYVTSQQEEEWSSEIALRRLGRPEDIADVIVFLASEQARWLTGQTILVSGGHTIPNVARS